MDRILPQTRRGEVRVEKRVKRGRSQPNVWLADSRMRAASIKQARRKRKRACTVAPPTIGTENVCLLLQRDVA